MRKIALYGAAFAAASLILYFAVWILAGLLATFSWIYVAYRVGRAHEAFDRWRGERALRQEAPAGRSVIPTI